MRKLAKEAAEEQRNATMPPRKGKEKANEQSKNKADPKTVTFGEATDMESDPAKKAKRLTDQEKVAWASKTGRWF